jgi:hypothetical protein
MSILQSLNIIWKVDNFLRSPWTRVTVPLLIQEMADLRAARTDYLLPIKLLKESAAPVEEWTLHPRSGSKVEWGVPRLRLLSRCACCRKSHWHVAVEGVEGDSEEPARRQYCSVHQLKKH